MSGAFQEEQVLGTGLLPGTELIVTRRLYRHHGIYVGQGRVIQYAGWFHSAQGLIEEVPVDEFTKRGLLCIGERPADRERGEEVVRRARSRLGERRYDLLRNNCEHFCSWCHFGPARSRQVEALSRPEYLFYQFLQGLRSGFGSRDPLPAAQSVMA